MAKGCHFAEKLRESAAEIYLELSGLDTKPFDILLETSLINSERLQIIAVFTKVIVIRSTLQSKHHFHVNSADRKFH